MRPHGVELRPFIYLGERDVGGIIILRRLAHRISSLFFYKFCFQLLFLYIIIFS